jgi:hypothetical protein
MRKAAPDAGSGSADSGTYAFLWPRRSRSSAEPASRSRGRFQAIPAGHPGPAAERRAPLYISARLIGPRGFESEVYDTPPWPEDEKVVAEELGPYLARLEAGMR